MYGALALLLLSIHAAAHPHCDLDSIDVEEVYTPDDPLFDEKRTDQYAKRLGTKALRDLRLNPKAIVYAKSESDVLETITFASSCGYELSIRSGGHQYTGGSSCKKGTECIQLDMSNFKNVDIVGDNEFAIIQPGCTVSCMVAELVPLGLFLPTGVCAGVAAGGHFQTSGNGFFARAFGLAMDHVVSFRLATAEAEIIEVSRESDENLYDAVLGGGAGSFGVILDYTVTPLKAEKYKNSALLNFSFEYSRPLLDELDEYLMTTSALPEYARDLELFYNVQPLPGLSDPPVEGVQLKTNILFIGVWVGEDTGSITDPENAGKVLTPLIAISNKYNGKGSTNRLPLNKMWRNNFQNNWDYAYNYWNDNIVSESFLTTEQTGLIADEVDFYIDIPGVYVGYQPQIWGGNGKGSQVNRNVGMNGFPNRGVKVFIDFWVFFQTDEQAELVLDRMESFRKKRTEKWGEISKMERMWISTDTLTADTAKLSHVWPKYYPTKKFYRGLQDTKKEIDSCDLFHTDMTVPLPGKGKKSGKRSKSCKRERSMYRRN